MTFPDARLVVLVAMARNKDYLAFAREFLLDKQLEAVETDIAGGKSRTTTASLLRDYWVQASEEIGINTLHDGMAEFQDFLHNQCIHPANALEGRIILATEKSLEASMRVASKFLTRRPGNLPSVLVVTGSLHIVSFSVGSSTGKMHCMKPFFFFSK